MGVSLENYRIQIGINNLNGRNVQFKLRKCKEAFRQNAIFLTMFFLIFLVVHNPEKYCKIMPRQQYDTYPVKSVPCSYKAPVSEFSESVSTPAMFVSWSYSVKTSSALCQALFGNIRRLGYKLALWNCRKGLLGNEDFVSTKLIEIKNFIDKHSPHTLGIIESDIHSSRSQVRRKRTFNKEETSLYATVFSFIFGSYVRFSETLFI